MFVVGSRTRTSLMGVIYRKVTPILALSVLYSAPLYLAVSAQSLRLSPKARAESSSGEMVNLMQVNTQTLVDIVPFLNMLWSAPFQILVCLALLWQYLGPASLAMLAVIALSMPINGLVSKYGLFRLFKQKLLAQDRRIKLTNEVLSGIKVVKMFAWEVAFRDLIEKIRSEELQILKNKGRALAVFGLVSGAMSLFATVLCFVVYAAASSRHVLDAKTVFVSISLFNLVRFPMTMVPLLLNGLVLGRVALARIQAFLLREEIDEGQISSCDEGAITFEDVDLGWSEDECEPVLSGLSFTVKPGELVAGKRRTINFVTFCKVRSKITY